MSGRLQLCACHGSFGLLSITHVDGYMRLLSSTVSTLGLWCAAFLSGLQCGNTFLEMPVVVHEFVHHAVSQDEMAPQLFNNRSKLWRVLVPPDQLNPDGFVDASLENFSPLQVRRDLACVWSLGETPQGICACRVIAKVGWRLHHK